MTKEQFLYDAKAFIFKEVAKTTNILMGQSKTASIIATLFATLPLTVEARFVPDLPKPTKQLNTLNEFVIAYLKHDDSSKVMIAFLYSSEKHLTQIMKNIKKFPVYFAYLYMRETLKITRRINTKTHYQMMSNIIKKHKPEIPVNTHYWYSITASNYVVNATLSKLFKTTKIAPELMEIFRYEQLNPLWGELSEQKVLVELLEDTILPDVIQLDIFTLSSVHKTLILNEQEWDKSINHDESISTDLGESLKNVLTLASRGTITQAIFAESFSAKTVKTGWFKKLRTKMHNEVFYATNSSSSRWSSLNLTYRHKFKAPKHIFTKNKLSIVLSIDQSGSVNTSSLQELFYLFTQHSKNIAVLHILVHDTEIVKETHIQSQTDIAQSPDFNLLLGKRIAYGGTSHFPVFNRIADMIRTKVIDPDKTLYLSFSDNYSDIETSWQETPLMKKLYSTVFLTPVYNPMRIAGTTDIAIS